MKEIKNTNQIYHFDLPPGPGNSRNSEGDFIKLNNGRWLFIYSHFMEGDGGDHGAACLMSRFSDDQGRTWSEKDELVVANEGGCNVMSVSLLRLNSGEIALFYVRKNSLSDCRPVMRISRDQAQTWSEPVECITDQIGYYVLNNSRAIQLAGGGGRLLLPVALHADEKGGRDARPTAESSFVPRGRVMCYYSDDSGRSWRRSKTVLQLDEAPDNREGLREPAVIELEDGRVMMLCRTGMKKQYISWSTDGGETFSPAVPSTIASPDSPASIRRIPTTGDLLLVWNNNGADNRRTPLNLAISSDEGANWKNIKTLEDNPNGHFCYTAIAFTDDAILLAYCAGNNNIEVGLSRTRLTRLTLDWLYT